MDEIQTAAVYVSPDGILLAIGDALSTDDTPQIVHLCTPRAGCYVHAWHPGFRDTYQITVDSWALSWSSGTIHDQARQFADDYNARYYKTRAGFDRACRSLNEKAYQADSVDA